METSPVGFIGMACGENARYSDTYASLIGLNKPAGTAFLACKSMSVAENFNRIARDMLKTKAEWLFLVNDDQVWAPDALTRLLAHNVDVVSGLYLSRSFPFKPVIFDQVDSLGRVFDRFLAPGESGLKPIKAAGDGCLLIRRHVLEALTDPWWELGNPDRDKCCHDILFSHKVTSAGFQMYADLDVVVGHFGLFTIYPHRDEQGQWHTLLSREGHHIALPAAQSPFNPYSFGGSK